MVALLSIDLRLRVAATLEEGKTVRSAAKRFGVSVDSAVSIGQRQHAGRGQVPGKIGGHRCPVLTGVTGDWLLVQLAEKPNLTMRALTPELAERGVRVVELFPGALDIAPVEISALYLTRASGLRRLAVFLDWLEGLG